MAKVKLIFNIPNYGRYTKEVEYITGMKVKDLIKIALEGAPNIDYNEIKDKIDKGTLIRTYISYTYNNGKNVVFPVNILDENGKLIIPVEIDAPVEVAKQIIKEINKEEEIIYNEEKVPTVKVKPVNI